MRPARPVPAATRVLFPRCGVNTLDPFDPGPVPPGGWTFEAAVAAAYRYADEHPATTYRRELVARCAFRAMSGDEALRMGHPAHHPGPLVRAEMVARLSGRDAFPRPL